MFTLGLLLVLYFSVIVFTAPVSSTAGNSVLSYYALQSKFAFENITTLMALFIAGSLVFVIKHRKPLNKIAEKYTKFLFDLLKTVLGASFVAFLLLLFIGALQLNILSVFTYVNPKLLGVEVNGAVIAKKLMSSGNPPVMVAEDKKEAGFCL